LIAIAAALCAQPKVTGLFIVSSGIVVIVVIIVASSLQGRALVMKVLRAGDQMWMSSD
jgi:hypothetical protein